MSTLISPKGLQWFEAMTKHCQSVSTPIDSVRIADGELGAHSCRFLLVTANPQAHFPRARRGEVGLQEGIALAEAINDVIEQDAHSDSKRTLVAIVDTPSQAYGRREEAMGIHQALAASVSAYARARQAGHPVIALLVGKAMSGAFLAHGYQADRILTLANDDVMVHAMGKAAAARITMRTEDELDLLARSVPPMAYDLQSYASLGLVDTMLELSPASSDSDVNEPPGELDTSLVEQALRTAQADILKQPRGLSRRLHGQNRQASLRVRQMLAEQWNAGA